MLSSRQPPTPSQQPLLSQDQIKSELMEALGKVDYRSRLLATDKFMEKLGDMSISRPTLDALKDALKASGKNADRFFSYGLPAAIQALGGNITEQQLGQLAAIAEAVSQQASGKDAWNLLRYSLPAAIQALGGNITEQQLESVGGKLTAIAQALGENAGRVLELGLPTVIQALGGNITEKQLESVGEKLAAIAQASGKDAWHVFHNGLPAAIQALGGNITEKQLGQLAAIAQAAAGDAVAAFQSIPTLVELKSDLAPLVLLESLLGYWQGKDPANLVAGDTVETISRLAKLVWHPDQSFRSPKEDFTKRIKEWLEQDIAPVLTLPEEIKFIVDKNSKAEPYLIKNKTINSELLEKYREHFIITPQKRETALSSLAQIATLSLGNNLAPGSEAELKFIQEALKAAHAAGNLLKALKSVRALLPELTKMDLTLPSGNEPLEVRRFYQSLQNAIEGHIPETLRMWGIELDDKTKRVFIDNYLSPLKGELSKFANGNGSKERRTVQVVATKSVYDAFYDAIGENCSGQYGFELSNPIFQPLRLIEPSTGEHYGVVYALKGQVEGRPALILAGVEIRKQYAYTIKQSKFIPALMEQLGKIARHNGLEEIWTTVGGPEGENFWSDDGRISQYDVTREALCGMSEIFINLPSNEQIPFPRDFKTPIKRVLKVWSAGGVIRELEAA